MQKTKLSTKGQLILPKSIRDLQGWSAGAEFLIELTTEGVLFRPTRPQPSARLEDIAGRLKHRGKTKTVEQMDAGIKQFLKKQHARGRY